MSARVTAEPGRPPPDATGAGRGWWWPALAAAAQPVLVGVLYAFLVADPTGRALDGVAVGGARALLGPEQRTPLWVALNIAPAVPLLVAALLLWRRLRAVRGGRPLLVAARDLVPPVLPVAVLVAGAVLTTEVLKHLLLVRPGEPNTLPSGHTTLTAAGVVAVVALLPPARRLAVLLAGSAFAALTGAGTIVATWHRPSDVAAALLVTGAWTAAVVAVTRARGRSLDGLGPDGLGPGGLPDGPRRRLPRGLLPLLVALAAAGLAAAGAVLAWLGTLPVPGLPAPERLLGLAGGVAGSLGLGALLAAGLVVLLARPAAVRSHGASA